jgi:voltage-gated potassium channel Kch
MKVIICGAGQVGFNIARYLASENADITVIDQSSVLVEKVTDSLDVQGIVGFASHPDVLERAGAAEVSDVSAHEQIQDLERRVSQAIIGQKAVVERLIIGLLANGNLLIEGLPGLAKTRAIKALAKNLEANFGHEV